MKVPQIENYFKNYHKKGKCLDFYHKMVNSPESCLESNIKVWKDPWHPDNDKPYMETPENSQTRELMVS